MGNFDFWTPRIACDIHDNEEKEPRFLFFIYPFLSLEGLDASGVCNILLRPWTETLNEDLFLCDFAAQLADGAASPCLRLGQPNESEGGLSALFPAPLHLGFPAVMSAILRSLFLGKSLCVSLRDQTLS